jgi:hypothetical protein
MSLKGSFDIKSAIYANKHVPIIYAQPPLITIIPKIIILLEFLGLEIVLTNQILLKKNPHHQGPKTVRKEIHAQNHGTINN